jgi:hypothetical protein
MWANLTSWPRNPLPLRFAARQGSPLATSLRGHMTTESTIAFMDAAAETLKLEIRPEWKPSVASFFDVARNMASLVEESGAQYRSEMTPVFVLRDVE